MPQQTNYHINPHHTHHHHHQQYHHYHHHHDTQHRDHTHYYSQINSPKICTVEAGHLANEVNEPAFCINLAATVSPINALKLGATVAIFSSRYEYNCLRYNAKDIILSVKIMIFIISCSDVSIPIDDLAAFNTFFAMSSSPSISERPGNCSSVSNDLSYRKKITTIIIIIIIVMVHHNM